MGSAGAAARGSGAGSRACAETVGSGGGADGGNQGRQRAFLAPLYAHSLSQKLDAAGRGLASAQHSTFRAGGRDVQPWSAAAAGGKLVGLFYALRTRRWAASLSPECNGASLDGGHAWRCRNVIRPLLRAGHLQFTYQRSAPRGAACSSQGHRPSSHGLSRPPAGFGLPRCGWELCRTRQSSAMGTIAVSPPPPRSSPPGSPP